MRVSGRTPRKELRNDYAPKTTSRARVTTILSSRSPKRASSSCRMSVGAGCPHTTTQAMTMMMLTGQAFPALRHETGIARSYNPPALEAMQDSDVSLSARERTIVLLMGHGLTNKMIARQLSIAPETVKSHAKRVFLKLTVQTRAQAVYRASTLGLL